MQVALLTFKQLKTQELEVFKRTVFFTMYFSFISFVYFLVSPNPTHYMKEIGLKFQS